MPVLYRVTEEEVLASAGLDAYVVSNNFIPYTGGRALFLANLLHHPGQYANSIC